MNINPIYTKKETQKQILEVFAQRTQYQNIRLRDFFKNFAELKELSKNIKTMKTTDPLSHSYSYNQNTEIVTKKILSPELQEIFDLWNLKNPTFTLYTFTHRDFTMLLDTKTQENEVFDIFIDLSDDWKEEWGGSYVFIDQNGEYIELEPLPNTLTIIKRKPGERFFTKYINHYAKDKTKRILHASVQ
ncbi:MAG: hypothetical protein ACMXYA_00395 [Candidatus Woesearchaeota archaeon]